MDSLKIRSFIRGSLGNRYSGRRVREAIEKAFESNQELELDFSGVPAVSQGFLDEALGVIVRREGPHVTKRLRFLSCESEIREMLEFVIAYSEEVARSGGMLLTLPLGSLESATDVALRIQPSFQETRMTEGTAMFQHPSSEAPEGSGWIALLKGSW